MKPRPLAAAFLASALLLGQGLACAEEVKGQLLQLKWSGACEFSYPRQPGERFRYVFKCVTPPITSKDGRLPAYCDHILTRSEAGLQDQFNELPQLTQFDLLEKEFCAAETRLRSQEEERKRLLRELAPPEKCADASHLQHAEHFMKTASALRLKRAEMGAPFGVGKLYPESRPPAYLGLEDLDDLARRLDARAKEETKRLSEEEKRRVEKTKRKLLTAEKGKLRSVQKFADRSDRATHGQTEAFFNKNERKPDGALGTPPGGRRGLPQLAGAGALSGGVDSASRFSKYQQGSVMEGRVAPLPSAYKPPKPTLVAAKELDARTNPGDAIIIHEPSGGPGPAAHAGHDGKAQKLKNGGWLVQDSAWGGKGALKYYPDTRSFLEARDKDSQFVRLENHPTPDGKTSGEKGFKYLTDPKETIRDKYCSIAASKYAQDMGWDLGWGITPNQLMKRAVNF